MVATIEFNKNYFFKPLARSLRGRLDFRAIPGGHKLAAEWPEPIPGQRLELDPKAKTITLLEPLHEHRYASKIRQRGEELEPAVQRLKVDDFRSWTWHAARAVASGMATVVEGKLPSPEAIEAEADGEIRRNYREPVRPKPVDPMTLLARAVDRLCSIIPAAK